MVLSVLICTVQFSQHWNIDISPVCSLRKNQVHNRKNKKYLYLRSSSTQLSVKDSLGQLCLIPLHSTIHNLMMWFYLRKLNRLPAFLNSKALSLWNKYYNGTWKCLLAGRECLRTTHINFCSLLFSPQQFQDVIPAESRERLSGPLTLANVDWNPDALI